MTDSVLALLDELPPCVQVDESIAWLNVNRYQDGYQAGYLHGDGLYEQRLVFCGLSPLTPLRHLRDTIKWYEESGDA